MSKPVRYLVSALPGVLGKAYDQAGLIDALRDAREMRGIAGFEGKLFAVMDDGLIREFDFAARQFTAPVAFPF